MPLIWIAGCLLIALFTRSDKRRRKFLLAGVMLIALFGNNFLANEAFIWWEVPVTPLKTLRQDYDVAIILTGVTDTERKPQDRVYFQRGADRVMHPLQLFKMGKVKHFLISGGSGRLVGTKESESEELAQVLRMCGVPDSCITIENRSRNTHENALFSAEILTRQFPKQSYLLVTSAFHMRRAEGCFKKAGIPVTLFSTDFYSHPRKITPDAWLIPSEGAIGKWSVIWHEWIGYLMYWLMGYVV